MTDTDTHKHLKLHKYIEDIALDHPEKQALIFQDRVTTYGDFWKHSCQVANGLAQMGVDRGARVSYLGKNTDIFFEVLIGLGKMGATLCPLNWRLAAPELAFILSEVEPSAIFVQEEFYELLLSALEGVEHTPAIIPLDFELSGAQPFEPWRDAQDSKNTDFDMDEEDILVIIYTSGSTGLPKGVMLSHRAVNIMRQIDHGASDKWTFDDVTSVDFALFHMSGISWAIDPLKVGGTCIINLDFSVTSVQEVVKKHRSTRLLMIPAPLKFLLDHPDTKDIDFSCVKLISYGGAPMNPKLIEQARSTFDCGFMQGYGMTEQVASITHLRPDEHDENRAHLMLSVGRPRGEVEIEIRGEDGEVLRVGGIGDVFIKSRSVMSGYWRRPEETAKALPGGGWYRSGDVGSLDEDGYLYLHDRAKDMIVTGGENVYPAEVERVLLQHPAVSEAAVFGVPDERWGESVKALLLLKDGKAVSADEVISFSRENLAGYKVPKSIEFVDEFPRTSIGKIAKAELKKKFWGDRDRMVN